MDVKFYQESSEFSFDQEIHPSDQTEVIEEDVKIYQSSDSFDVQYMILFMLIIMFAYNVFRNFRNRLD